MKSDKLTLIEFVNSSPLVHAAITEAVHRYYMDVSQDAKEELNYLWSMNPSWRKTIEDASKRYHPSATNAIQYFGQKTQIFDVSVSIQKTNVNTENKKAELIANSIMIGIWVCVFLVAFVKCQGQDNNPPAVKLPDCPQQQPKVIASVEDPADRKLRLFKQHEDSIIRVRQEQDTTSVWLQYRLPSGQSGIVKGWEVIKRGEKIDVCNNPGCAVYHGDIFEIARKMQDTHIAYLRSDRRRFPKGTLIWKLQEPVKQ